MVGVWVLGFDLESLYLVKSKDKENPRTRARVGNTYTKYMYYPKGHKKSCDKGNSCCDKNNFCCAMENPKGITKTD